jgi:hypothetical protein
MEKIHLLQPNILHLPIEFKWACHQPYTFPIQTFLVTSVVAIETFSAATVVATDIFLQLQVWL